MKKVFTPDYIRANKGCYGHSQVDELSFITQPEITIQDILNSEIPLKDKAWFLRSKCELTTLQKQWFAIGCAEVVLEIYETKYPGKDAPRKAIEAAKNYLNIGGETALEELKTARRAAAADAAYTAAAAAAADAAADADAADAAADAAYTAADAADAADAEKPSYKEALLTFLKTFAETTPLS